MVDKVISVFIMIVILAMLAVVLNPKSNAPQLLAGLFSGFSSSVNAAQGV